MEGPVADTTIDKLVTYLKEHGETDSDSLAKVLNINESMLSTWANALEEANIVKVEYKYAKMFLSPTSATPQPKQARKQAGIVESEIASLETIAAVKHMLQENVYDGDGLPPE